MFRLFKNDFTILVLKMKDLMKWKKKRELNNENLKIKKDLINIITIFLNSSDAISRRSK